MTIRSMHHVGVVVGDLAAATEFFLALGLELEGEASVEGEVVDRLIALAGVRSEIAMLRTPDGASRIELTEFKRPESPEGDRRAPSNAPGLRHLAFEVDDVDATLAALRARGGELVGELATYGTSYRLCYVRGPEGVIVELAESAG
jgi:catechol 2,3-dioxygenase-like lactoylglutathione lyase family enzyme